MKLFEKSNLRDFIFLCSINAEDKKETPFSVMKVSDKSSLRDDKFGS